MPELNEVPQDALAGIDEDTKAILDEAAKEGQEVFGLEPKPVTPEPKAEEPEKPSEPKIEKEPEKVEEKPDKSEKSDREIKFVPAWKMEVAQKHWETEKQQMQSEYEAKLKELSEASQKAGTDPTPKQAADIEAKKAEISEKYGISAEVVDALGEIYRNDLQKSLGITPEKLKLIDEIKERQQSEFEEQAYRNDFAQTVEPLIKAEYPEASQEFLSNTREKLKEYAYSQDYAPYKLAHIYQLVPEFREAINTKRKSAESGKGGIGRSQDTVDFENMTDEQYASMSMADQDRYDAWVVEREKQGKRR